MQVFQHQQRNHDQGVAITAMLELMFSRMPLNTGLGNLDYCGSARKRVTTTSSNKVAALKVTPNEISGSITRLKVVNGSALKLAAAQ